MENQKNYLLNMHQLNSISYTKYMHIMYYSLACKIDSGELFKHHNIICPKK